MVRTNIGSKVSVNVDKDAGIVRTVGAGEPDSSRVRRPTTADLKKLTTRVSFPICATRDLNRTLTW